MTAPMYTVRKLLEIHRKDSPDSMLSERTIRNAVRSGKLPSIKSGNRSLIRLDIFEQWLRGEFRE